MEDRYSLVDQAHNKKEGVLVASGKEMSVCNIYIREKNQVVRPECSCISGQTSFI